MRSGRARPSSSPGAEAQLPPLGLRVPRRLAPLLQQAQLVFGHGPLEPEEQAIVDEPRLVHAIGIDHQGPYERTEVDQLVPVPPVAREARRFDAEHGPDGSAAHRRNEPLIDVAVSASAYWRRRLSVCSSTWATLDCRT